mmetsp:Transcript_33537/g.101326  ORF Transcript_33537/g.101326 Transcript_33537/m.101326 type:complete len:394 (-) Transcript_33537:159-1340(-)
MWTLWHATNPRERGESVSNACVLKPTRTRIISRTGATALALPVAFVALCIPTRQRGALVGSGRTRAHACAAESRDGAEVTIGRQRTLASATAVAQGAAGAAGKISRRSDGHGVVVVSWTAIFGTSQDGVSDAAAPGTVLRLGSGAPDWQGKPICINSVALSGARCANACVRTGQRDDVATDWTRWHTRSIRVQKAAASRTLGCRRTGAAPCTLGVTRTALTAVDRRDDEFVVGACMGAHDCSLVSTPEKGCTGVALLGSRAGAPAAESVPLTTLVARHAGPIVQAEVMRRSGAAAETHASQSNGCTGRALRCRRTTASSITCGGTLVGAREALARTGSVFTSGRARRHAGTGAKVVSTCLRTRRPVESRALAFARPSASLAALLSTRKAHPSV